MKKNIKRQSKLEKEIDKLARERGYPHVLLNHEQYIEVLRRAHDNIFPRVKPAKS